MGFYRSGIIYVVMTFISGATLAQDRVSLEDYRLLFCFTDARSDSGTIALRLKGTEAIVLPLGIAASLQGNMVSWHDGARYLHLTGDTLLVVEEGETRSARCVNLAPAIQTVAFDLVVNDPIQLAGSEEFARLVDNLKGQLTKASADLETARSNAAADLARARAQSETDLSNARRNAAAELARVRAQSDTDLARERGKTAAALTRDYAADKTRLSNLDAKLKSALENNERLIRRICELDPAAQYSACDQ